MNRSCLFFLSAGMIKNSSNALAGVAQSIVASSVSQKVMGWIPDQGTCPGHGFDP